MTPAMRNDGPNSESREEGSTKKRHHFELSTWQLFLYGLCLLLTFSWMFAFGVLIGRGTPLVKGSDLSPKAQLFRFLGLGREVAPPPANVASTWEDPRKMLESLSYYQDLTQQGSPVLPPALPKLATPLLPPQVPSGPAAPTKEAAGEAKPKPPQPPAPEKAAKAQPEKPPAPPAAPEPQENAPPEKLSEHFTLLISSLKDTENAQKMVEQLRGKGYPSRLESLDLSGSGRWNRVLIGSFRSRDEAMHFAAEFNRKERMEGLVIRESN